MALIFALILTLLSSLVYADKLELYYDDGNTLENLVEKHTGKKVKKRKAVRKKLPPRPAPPLLMDKQEPAQVELTPQKNTQEPVAENDSPIAPTPEKAGSAAATPPTSLTTPEAGVITGVPTAPTAVQVEKTDTLPKKKAKQRQPAKAFKNGTYRLKRDCLAYDSPETTAQTMGKILKGKKIWVDGHNESWRKIYLRKGEGYLQGDCL
jgi:hypothetical protein